MTDPRPHYIADARDPKTGGGVGRVAYIRHNRRELAALERFGPKRDGHPSVGLPCFCCCQPMRAGEYTTLIPLGPADDAEAREKAREGRWYVAVAIEVHYACATGEEAR